MWFPAEQFSLSNMHMQHGPVYLSSARVTVLHKTVENSNANFLHCFPHFELLQAYVNLKNGSIATKYASLDLHAQLNGR